MSAVLAIAVAWLAPEPLILPVAFHVVHVEGQPVVERAWIDRRVARANQLFGPHGVRFRVASVTGIPASHRRIVRRADRDALGVHLQPKVINCMVVGYLEDVDEPGLKRRGVHWRIRGTPGRRMVIVAAYSSPTVLAHELGHFLGQRRHSAQVDNLMSYRRGGGPIVLQPAQGLAMRAAALAFLR